jgi:hypothetical protein
MSITGKRFRTVTAWRPGVETPEGEPIHLWQRLLLNGGDDLLCYYPDKDGKGHGFMFYCVTWTASNVDPLALWDDEDTYVECICSGIAYFDGIRHLNFGDTQTDNVGYFNYPSMRRMIAVMQALATLQEEWCRAEDFRP